MGWEQPESWLESFDKFMSKFDDLYLRSESREKAKLYVRGFSPQLRTSSPTEGQANIIASGVPFS